MSDTHPRPEQVAAQSIRRLFYRFARLKTAGAVAMLVCAVVALLWANSPWRESYFRLWEMDAAVTVNGSGVAESLLHWINDGLMAIFFFVVGLEIKREMCAGELSDRRHAALPVAAALGGMVVPALIYAGLNLGRESVGGWGVPMATDIAFSLGILALLGRRVPLGLKVFLAALAIADDIGAILVIAVYYTSTVSWAYLAVAGVLLLFLVGCNRGDVRRPLPYAVIGVCIWLALLKSGIHATVAGVLVALTVPARMRLRGGEFVARSERLLREYECTGADDAAVLTNQHCQAVIDTLHRTAEAASTPLQRFVTALHPWVTFAILPLFALVNAGIDLSSGLVGVAGSRVAWGVVGGLVLGKPAGILLCSWLAVRTGLATLPAGVTWRHMLGVGCLAGVGFTMSIFIGDLAFADHAVLDQAKIAVLLASCVAGAVGYGLLVGAPAADDHADDPDEWDVTMLMRGTACDTCAETLHPDHRCETTDE